MSVFTLLLVADEALKALWQISWLTARGVVSEGAGIIAHHSNAFVLTLSTLFIRSERAAVPHLCKDAEDSLIRPAHSLSPLHLNAGHTS